MLIVEILNDKAHEAGCPTGSYDYVVRVNRRVIATGRVENHDRTKHWSLLLKKIAEDGRERLFTEVMGVTPEEFKQQRPDKVDGLEL